MKKRNLLVGLFSILGLATMSNTMFAQQNLGAACGCPAVSTRGTANINSVGTWTTLPSSAYGKELQGSQNITLTCGTIWTLDEKLYIGSGATITIEPGTVIKASNAGTNVAAARALIIERGGKIIAPGIEDCPIVFTAALDPLNGTYGVANKGQWGGILICGTASNNLTLAANGPFIPGQGGKMAVADGLGVLEGFASSYPQDQFGVALSVPAGTSQSTSPSGSYSFVLEAGAASSSNTVGSNKINFASALTASSGTSGQNTITFSSVPSHVAVGQPISGTGIPSGSTITAINTNTLTISSNLTAAASTTAAYTVNFVPNYVVQGQTVSGTGIPSGTTILSIASNILTLSANLTSAVNAGDDITFSGTYPNGGVVGYFTTMTYVAPFSGTAPVSGTSGIVSNYVGAYYASTGGFNDNDNSGVMTYVSIRYSGANLLVGSEINGLTLASVGRGTKIEHVEIVSCADDNIELFGGTVDLKYCTTIFGNDDMYDYDLGWSGRAQFLFGMKAQQAGSSLEANAISFDNDNGFECDSDDNTNNATLKSNPKIYNATIMGNAKGAGAAPNNTGSADNRGLAAINMKEAAQGTISNSVFANFKNGFNIENSLTNRSAAGQGNSFQYWSTIPQSTGSLAALEGIGTSPTPSLIVKCNHFIGMANPFVIGASTISGTTTVTTPTAATTQFGADGNVTVTGNTLAGFNYDFTINGGGGTNQVTQKNDVVPNPALPLNVGTGTGCTQAPMDGFFEPANYRGAFSSVAGDNWLSDWSYSQVLGSTTGVQACPTDLNGDGATDVNDFLIFAPAFGTNCN